MAKIDYSKIRYIEVVAFWKILIQINSTPNAYIGEIIKAVKKSYTFGGSLPANIGFNFCVSQGHVDIDEDSKVCLSSKGEGVIIGEKSDEPSFEVLRKLIGDILIHNRFPWIVFCNRPSNEFRLAIPDNWEVILDNCKLFDMEDAEVVKWWASLFRKYNDDREKRNKEIGNAGEVLSFRFEKERISQDGIDPTLKVKLVASVDDFFGYDVLSVKGKYFDGELEEEIQIEVKSSERKDPSFFRFSISRNEWDTAVKDIDNYFIHCWVGVKLDGSYDSGPYLIAAKDLTNQLPKDQSAFARWKDCKVSISLIEHAKLLS